MFKIAPRYVKNGTLDGYVGFQKDKDYAELATGERGSYFKPLEAYALKSLIAREQHQLKAYYDQYDAPAVGQGGDIRGESRNLGNLLLNLPGNDTISRDEWKAQIARRSLVNTYVWNSDGGLYSEEEQFGAVREESVSGSYELVGQAGVYAEASVMIGPAASFEMLFGGRIHTKAMKSRRDATSFGIHVNMPGEGLLNKRMAALPEGFPEPGQYPVAYDPDACPGKVNQYRFMSFYLAPRKKNFDDFHKIVDQDWLEQDQGVRRHLRPGRVRAQAGPRISEPRVARVTSRDLREPSPARPDTQRRRNAQPGHSQARRPECGDEPAPHRGGAGARQRPDAAGDHQPGPR